MKEKTVQYIILMWLLAFVFSLFYSKYVLSLSMFLLTLTGIIYQIKNRRTLQENFKKNTYFLIYTLYFILILLSLVFGGITPYGLVRLRIVIPFLILPFAFWMLPKVDKSIYFYAWIFFIGLLSFAELNIVYQFLSHQSFYILELKRGHVLPTPIHHIRFSILVATSIIGALWWGNMYQIYSVFFYLLAVVNFVFIHFLAVKTGIVCAYVGLFVYFGFILLQKKKYTLAIILVLGLCTTPFIAYYTVPSLYAKVNYMDWDLKQFAKGSISGYSDGQRLQSYYVGWDIIKNNKYLGTGIGHFEEQVKEMYAQKHPDAQQKMKPHNQFLFSWGSMGFMGLIISIISWFGVLLFINKDSFLLSFNVLMMASFFVENTLGTAVGVAIFLLFNLLHLNVFKENLDTQRDEKTNLSIRLRKETLP